MTITAADLNPAHIALTDEERIEDAVAEGDMALHLASRRAKAESQCTAKAEAQVFWADAEYDYRVCSSPYEQWYWDHYLAP